MTPQRFVAAMKKVIRTIAKSEAEYYERPESATTPEHLAAFSAWYQRLSAKDRKIARRVIQYASEGCLFTVLTYLDNIACLTEERGTFELWHVSERGKRTRLNAPDGQLLNELFNNV